jgi:hypothetical protein
MAKQKALTGALTSGPGFGSRSTGLDLGKRAPNSSRADRAQAVWENEGGSIPLIHPATNARSYHPLSTQSTGGQYPIASDRRPD